MKKYLINWRILLAIGVNSLFWGMTLKSFGIISDRFNGFLVGFGVTVILGALFADKIKNGCEKKLA